MTRKNFLEAMAGAAAYAAASGPAGAAASKGALRRGVSLYCYQEEFYKRAMTLEDCLSEASSIGASAIELLPEEMVPDFPNPSDRWVDQWRGWMEKYRLVADTYTQFQDTVLIKGQDLAVDEGVAMLERDLKLARRMGFKNMRLLIGTPLDVIAQAIPLAHDLLVEGARNLRDYFQAQGYFDAQVEFKQQKVINDKSNVDFLVNTGKRHKLVAIAITGNHYFSSDVIRERMYLQTANWLQFPHGRYSESLVRRDRESISNLYESNGFRDVKVTSRATDAYLGKEDNLAVTLEIQEGP